MDKLTKRSAIFVIVLSVIFTLLIPLGIYLENRFDAINTQLLLQQAAGSVEYSTMVGIKAWLKAALVVLNVCKLIIGIFMILLGIIILNRNLPKKEDKKLKEKESKNKGEIDE